MSKVMPETEFEAALQDATVAVARADAGPPLAVAFRTLNDVAMRTDEATRERVIMTNRNGFGAMMDAMVADRATYNPYIDGVIRTSVLGLERGRPTTFRAWKERFISKRMLEAPPEAKNKKATRKHTV